MSLHRGRGSEIFEGRKPIFVIVDCGRYCSVVRPAALQDGQHAAAWAQHRAELETCFPVVRLPGPRSECLLSPAIDMSISHNYTEMAITVSCHTLPPLDTDMMNMMRYVHNLIASYYN